MGIEGLLMTGILLLGTLALLGPMGHQRVSSELQDRGLPDNREIGVARNRYARIRFSRNWPQTRRSQFL